MRPLFIIGNKRSGTSQLVRMLNLHPEVFISHESDIVWILHQFHHGQQPFKAHRWDSDRGMKQTLSDAGHLLQPDRTPWENFQIVLKYLMEKGSPWLPPMQKSNLRWLGDKKPFQHSDPQLAPFIIDHFPGAQFLHIVRHPCAVAASSDDFNRSPHGDFWQGLSPEEKIARWTLHEKLVADLKRKHPVHTLRYEDFCRQTEQTLARVFEFLELTPDAMVLKQAARRTVPAGRAWSKIHCPTETLQMAAVHGYDLEKPTSRLHALGGHWYWKLAKQLH